MKAIAATNAAISGRPVGAREPSRLGPPGLQGINVAGVTNAVACACYPPDTHGAVGNTQYVQIVNSRLVVYDKVTFAQQLNVSLNAFFGNGGSLLFDPRAIYDANWDRWILTAEQSNSSTTVQLHYIAISTGSNAAGSYFIYPLDVDVFNNNDFFDYPQLGQDIDSISVTANIFPAAGGFAGADDVCRQQGAVLQRIGILRAVCIPAWPARWPRQSSGMTIAGRTSSRLPLLAQPSRCTSCATPAGVITRRSRLSATLR